MIAAWICPRLSPGWWTRRAPRRALTGSWPSSAAGCWPTACRWRAETGAVIEALAFAGAPPSQAGRDWLAGLGPVQEDTVGRAPDSPVLGWAGPGRSNTQR